MSIYFITDGKYIKIGFSNGNIKNRLSDLQVGNRRKLKLLGVMNGDKEDERALHKQFKKDCVSGEWYKKTPDILELIDNCEYGPNDNVPAKIGFTPTKSIFIDEKGIDDLYQYNKNDIIYKQSTQIKLEDKNKTKQETKNTIGTFASNPYKKTPSGASIRAKAKQKQDDATDQKVRLFTDIDTKANKKDLTPSEIVEVLELPIYQEAPPQLQRAINATLLLQGKGYFLPSAILCDNFLRDEKIFSFLQVRINSLLGSHISIKPADDSEKAKELQEDIDKNFSKMCPINEMAELMRWGLLLGVGISQVKWETESKWMPTLQSWHMKYCWYNWAGNLDNMADKHNNSAPRCLMITTQSEGAIPILDEDIQWSVFKPYTNHLPWNRGLVFPLATIYLIRSCLLQWFAKHEERVGTPILARLHWQKRHQQNKKRFLSIFNN